MKKVRKTNIRRAKIKNKYNEKKERNNEKRTKKKKEKRTKKKKVPRKRERLIVGFQGVVQLGGVVHGSHNGVLCDAYCRCVRHYYEIMVLWSNALCIRSGG